MAELRCKPGDLAVVVRGSLHIEDWLAAVLLNKLVGRVVRVVRYRPAVNDTCIVPMVWELQETIVVRFLGDEYELNGVADECLRPLPAPGEVAEHDRVRSEPVTQDEQDAYICPPEHTVRALLLAQSWAKRLTRAVGCRAEGARP